MDPSYSRGHRSSDHRRLIRVEAVILLAALAAYAANQLLLKSLTSSLIVHGHINDALAPAVVLAIGNVLTLASPFHSRVFVRFFPALVVIAVAAAYWELIAPLYRPSRGDWFDVVSYLLGTVAYVVSARVASAQLRADRNRCSVMVGATVARAVPAAER